ncbi:MAG: LacI family DNA-binding transcriptional regulator [Oscillospiraceae bacterium]
MANIREIAALAGVSRGTVDRALNHRPGVNPETADEICKIAASLGYHPNVAGKLLAAQKKVLRLAFIILETPDNVFFDDIRLAAISKAENLKPFGVEVLFFSITAFSDAFFADLFSRVEAANVDGIAIAPIAVKPITEFVRKMSEQKMPMVFFNVDEPSAQRLCYVGCDYVRAGHVAAGLTALCTAGRGTVGLVTLGDSHNQSYNDRVSGFTAELAGRYPNLALYGGGAPITFQHHDHENVRQTIRNHPEINAVYVVNLGDFSVCETARKAAEGRTLNIITNDLVPVQRQMLREGVISATLAQQPELQGALPLEILYEYLVFGSLPKQDVCHTKLDIFIGQNIS